MHLGFLPHQVDTFMHVFVPECPKLTHAGTWRMLKLYKEVHNPTVIDPAGALLRDLLN